MKKQSKPRITLALRTETVRALAASELADAAGGMWSVPPACKRDTPTVFCRAAE